VAWSLGQKRVYKDLCKSLKEGVLVSRGGGGEGEEIVL